MEKQSGFKYYLNHLWVNRIKAHDDYKYRIAKAVVSFVGSLAIAYAIDKYSADVPFFAEDLDEE